MAELQTEGQVMEPGSGVWLALFPWRAGAADTVAVNTSGWADGTAQFRLRSRKVAGTATSAPSAWSPVRTINVALAVGVPFLAMDGTPVGILAGTWRSLPDEVSPSGLVARNWGATALARADADAAALRALASYNLVRTIGWQLRGQGYGDLALSGLAMDGAPVVARLEIEGSERHERSPGLRYQTISLRLREQVGP